jgi:hypothetical protein
MSRARCRGTRKTQLQLLAAATAINLKRLLNAQQARSGDQDANHAITTALLDLLGRYLTEIDRLTATKTSTGS